MAVVEATSMAAPERSVAQRMEALKRANAVRSYRAGVKRDMKQRRVTPVELLLDPPAQLGSMKVFDLLIATPKWGRVKVQKTLNQTRVSPSKTVGGLSPRQRAELVGLVARGCR